MQIEVVDTLEGFEALREEWEALVSRLRAPVYLSAGIGSIIGGVTIEKAPSLEF